MLKLKLQYFGHLMRRVDSSEKTVMLGEIGGRRRRGRRRMRWLDVISDSMDMGLGGLQDDIYIEVQYPTMGTFHGTIKLSLLRKLRDSNGTPLQYSCLENPMDRGAW